MLPRLRRTSTRTERAVALAFWLTSASAVASSFGVLAYRDDVISGWLAIAGFACWLVTVWITLGVAAHEGDLGSARSLVGPAARAVIAGGSALAWSVSWFENDQPGAAIVVPALVAAALAYARPLRVVAHFLGGLWLALAYTSWISC